MAVALGSNLGSREAHLRRGLRGLRDLMRGVEVGGLYESPPAGGAPPPDYLNTAAVGRSNLEPEQLLVRLQRLERTAGRQPGPAGAPRPLDLDLLLCGDLERDDAELRLPHPRMRDRAFVLAPLADVAPEWPLPPDGKTVQECLDAVSDRGGLVRRGWSRPPLAPERR